MHWLSRWFPKSASPSKSRSNFRSFRPALEVLEDRRLLTPTAVPLLAPSGGTSSTPTFTWSGQSDAAYYNFTITDLNTGQSLAGNELTSTSIALGAPLTLGNTYQWSVEAVDSDGNIGPWAPDATIGITNLGAPTLIGPSGSASAQPTFSWNALNGAVHYEVWLKNQTTNEVVTEFAVTGTSWAPAKPLAQGSTYIWEVQGVDGNNVGGPWSNSLTFSESVLPAPTPVGPSGGSVATPTLSWSAVSGADHYDVWLENQTTGLVTRDTDVTGTTWSPSSPLTLADNYTWSVRAIDPNGYDGQWSVSESFTPYALAEPTLASPSGTAVTLPTFTWSAVTGADHYDIWINNLQTGQVLRDQTVDGTSWTPASSLTTGDSYQWWVRAIDANGNTSGWSSSDTFTAYVLPAPTLTGPTGSSSTLPTFTWNAATGADHYDIWVQDTNTGAVVRDQTVDGTSWTPASPLNQGDGYTWWVRAITSTGAGGGWSSSLSFTVAALPEPTLVGPNGSSTLLPTFTWNAVTGADHYDISVQNTQTGQVLGDQTVDGTSWTPASSLIAGDTYHWWVRAVDSNDSPGSWSSTTAFTAYMLAAPSLIGPTGSSSTLPTFTWNAVTGADHYDIWVQDTHTGALLRDQTVSGTSWTPASPLNQGDGYTWWVRAITSTSIGGAWSSSLSFTVAALAAPTLVGPSGSSTTLPTFTWNAVTGADHYDIWIQNVQTGQVLRDQTVDGTSWTPASALTTGDTYNWWVRAIDSANSPGPWSSSKTFTA